MPLMWNGDSYEYVPENQRRQRNSWGDLFAFVIITALVVFVLHGLLFGGPG